MKIANNTPEQLILQNVPWAAGLTICAAIVALVGWALLNFTNGDTVAGVILTLIAIAVGVIFCVAVKRIDVLFDRSRNLFEIRRSTVFGRTRVRHELASVARAEVQTYSSPREPNKKFHRVAVILDGGMDKGTHPLTDSYENGRIAERKANDVAKAINDWLAQDVDSDAMRA